MGSKQKSANYGKWRRFRHNPRAMISLVLLVALYAVSLCTELICSSKPLYLKVRGHRYFPFLSFVSEKQLFGEGSDAAPDWAHFESDPRFSPANGDYVLFAPIRAGTSDIMRPEDFSAYRRKTITIKPDVKVGRCDVDADLRITGRPIGCEAFFDTADLSRPLPELLQCTMYNVQCTISTPPAAAEPVGRALRCPPPCAKSEAADAQIPLGLLSSEGNGVPSLPRTRTNSVENGRAGRPATAAEPEPGSAPRQPSNLPEGPAAAALASGDGQAVPGLLVAVSNRLSNIASPAISFTIGTAKISLTEFKPRSRPPKSVRLRIEEAESAATRPIFLTFERQGEEAQEPESPRVQDPPFPSHGRAGVSEGSALADPDPEGGDAKGIAAMGFKPINPRIWSSLSPSTRTEIAKLLTTSPSHPLTPDNCTLHIAHCTLYQNSSIITPYTLTVQDEAVTWPFRPVPGHPMGIDGNGRDVFACILSGTRTAMTFGIFLVAWAMLIGIVAGAVQGYFGGWADMAGQRFIEIWSSLPFLYVMILVGDVLGRSFGLLLFCYGLFNWIGVSYYVRAEFLRLRKRPFVEAAKCLGLSSRRIILRHILPNALTPVITLLPFSLVGAIASISALDFLGFGLPPLTPSWGELLQQAQENVSAWWLILYPSAMLFFVMLFAVFVGEGLRDAFDPKPAARYR